MSFKDKIAGLAAPLDNLRGPAGLDKEATKPAAVLPFLQALSMTRSIKKSINQRA
jgi:hypothetical protein